MNDCKHGYNLTSIQPRKPYMRKLRNNLLPGLPIVESSLFDELFETTMVDAESLRVAGDSNCEVCATFVFPNGIFERPSGTIFHSLDEHFDGKEWLSNGDDIYLRAASKFLARTKVVGANE